VKEIEADMQNKFQNFQNKFQTTVQGLNSNLTDGASRCVAQQPRENRVAFPLFFPFVLDDQFPRLKCRLRQQIVSQTSAFAPLSQTQAGIDGEGEDTKYVRLPVDSARQLRWYDQKDIKLLIHLHLKEKHELYLANAALRDALQKAPGKQSQVSTARLSKAIDRMASKDASISDILVLSAENEIEQLKADNARLKAEMRGAQVDCKAGELADGDAHLEQDSSQKESLGKKASEYETLLSTAQEALYQSESARVVAEEQLEKFQALSSSQQAELDELRSSIATKTADNQTLESKITVLEKELRHAAAHGNEQQIASRVKQELQAKLNDSSKQIKSLKDSLDKEISRNRVMEERIQADEVALNRAVSQVYDMEQTANERDELRAKVLYYDSYISDLKLENNMSVDLKERMAEMEEKLKSSQQELIATAKVAASLETKLAGSGSLVEKYKIELEKCKMKIEELQMSADSLVKEQWEQNWEDHSKWPPLAQEEWCAMEMRLKNLQSSLRNAEEELKDSESKNRMHAAKAEAAAKEAEAQKNGFNRLKAFSDAHIQRLESTTLVASKKLEEMKLKNTALEKHLQELDAKSTGTKSSQVLHVHAEPQHRFEFENGKQQQGTDMLYLKNIVIKYIELCMMGKFQECEVLLPAVVTVLRASPSEYIKIKHALVDASKSPLHWITFPIK